ncbi:MAG: hypothetical protein H0U39_01590, partial [Segetibacter sp.]|nr:hypothetical protein [Segetibacter sp.]
SALLAVPIDDPLRDILTPVKGFPASSRTVPLIVIGAAKAVAPVISSKAVKKYL